MNVSTVLARWFPLGLHPAHPAHLRSPRVSTAAPAVERRTLPRRQIMALDNRPLQFRVLRGSVWITRDGCAEDRVLDAGDVFEQRPGARVLVQAFEDSDLLIAGPGVQPHNG